jgi:acetyl-CoA carboxylase biotin carboxyl carrier protein
MTFEFSEKDINGLIQAVQQSDLTRFHMTTSEFEIYISRSDDEFDRSPIGAVVTHADTPSDAAPQQPPLAAKPAPTAPRQPVVQVVAQSADLVDVNAPMIGIFYGAPEPGADPYITVGSSVQKDTIVGLIEAMKLFTAAEAGIEGTVEEVLVANGDYVEFGQPLVRVRPATSKGT